MPKDRPASPNLSFMRRALRLARRGAGRASPNPLVGAVVVLDGEIVGEGGHVFAGRDHAEVIALLQAGSQARGSDLYVTLEPCAHTGRTPPCVERIADAGVRAVHVATRDPNPRVNGKGLEYLKSAGIHVYEGLCEEEARRLNEPFFHRIHTGRPLVTLKLAFSLDGRVATRSGSSQWITGERSRRLVHRLRFEHDAILVGRRTVAVDDPSLNVRGRRRNGIVKVVLDTRLRTKRGARLFESGDPVVMFHSGQAPAKRMERLSGVADLVAVKGLSGGLSWSEILEESGRRGWNSLLIEGGATVAASALRAGIVQHLLLFYGPKIIGGDGLPGFGPLGVESLDQAFPVELRRIRRLDQDFLVEARLG